MNAIDCECPAGRSTAYLSPVVIVLSYTILLGGLIASMLALCLVVISYSSLPCADGWETIFAAARGVDLLSWHWLWEQHNEHRLLIPKLFEVVDLRLFQGRQVFLLTSIFAIQLVHLALLAWSMCALGGWRGSVWRTGVGITAFCLFCPSQWENLIWGFQVCFMLPGLFASLSFVGLLLYWIKSEQQSVGPMWPFLALSVAAALGANWSLANGMLLWPLLIVAALMLRLRRSTTITFMVAGVASSGLYFYHYVRPADSVNPLTLLRTPIAVLRYVATYLGSAWVTNNIRAAMLLGAAGLVIAGVLLARCRRYIRTSQVFSVQLVLTLLFCLGTAFLTALGRVNLGLGQALSSRYQAVVLLFWWSAGLLILFPFFKQTQRRSPSILAQVFLIAIMLRGALLARQPMHEARSHRFALDTAAAALLTGVDDMESLQQIYPRPDSVSSALPYLRAHHLSVFSGGVSHAVGKPMDSVFRFVPGEDCRGAVDPITGVDQTGLKAMRISGWAWDDQHHRPAVAVVATNDGVITGWAAVGGWRPSVRAANRRLTTSYIGFAGYVREASSQTEVKLYAVLGGTPKFACPFASIEPIGQR